MTEFRPGDRVILSTQESRGPGTVVADSIIDGRVIVEWDAPCCAECSRVGHGLTTIPLAELLVHAPDCDLDDDCSCAAKDVR